LTALIISLILGPYIISYLKNKQFYQSIREDGPKSHLDDKNTTPTMGGIIIISSVVISTILWSDLSNSYVLILLFGILGFGAIGFYDDYKKLIKRNSDGIKGRLKLFLQIIFASTITIFLYLFMETGSIESVSPFLKDNSFYLGVLFIPWAIFILVGSSNAVNLTDGLDGLAILPCILIASAFVIFSYVHGNINISEYLLIPYIEGTGEIAIFAASLVGAGLGFLWFNSYPAEIFMGDCGSLSLGSSLGLLAVILKQELAFAIMSGIFVAEALSVIIQIASFKLRKGKRVFKMAPLHHHYELSGLSEPKIIMRFWIITFILVLIALSTLKIR
jgi:phospho-N-acetylmuramoyl-pentapeptide-transferase